MPLKPYEYHKPQPHRCAYLLDNFIDDIWTSGRRGQIPHHLHEFFHCLNTPPNPNEEKQLPKYVDYPGKYDDDNTVYLYCYNLGKTKTS